MGAIVKHSDPSEGYLKTVEPRIRSVMRVLSVAIVITLQQKSIKVQIIAIAHSGY